MLNLRHSALLTALQTHAATRGDKTAVVFNDRPTSYALLWERTLRAAAFLKTRGVQPGDRLLLAARKDADFLSLYLAAHLLGAVGVILDPAAKAERKAYVIERTKPKYAFGLNDEGSIPYGAIDFSLPPLTENVALIPAAPAEIMFTTGTTGAAKGVVLSHANLAASASNINAFVGNTADDVEVLALPLCHSFGLGRLRCNLLLGATVVAVESFANLKRFFDTLERYGASGFGMVPAVWEYMKKLSGERLGRYVDRLRYIEIGSAAMPLADKEILLRLLPHTRIAMHYGLTEASRSLFMTFNDNADSLATIGRPAAPSVEVKVMDEKGAETANGTVGELCVKGPMVLQSYLSSEDNRDAFFGDFFRTGDCGYRAADGRFYLVSRKKELINTGGKKVSPVEIEDAALATGGVTDCLCHGEPDPEGLLGEVPVLLLLKSGATMSIEDIRSALAHRLERYKLPARYEWVDHIPKTASGKKLRLGKPQE